MEQKNINGNQSIESPSDITIKIQTMDNSFQVNINTENTVLQLKEKITTLFKIPIESQRLIFQGKLMQDDKTISLYKIFNQCVVHLAARALEETQPRIRTTAFTPTQRQVDNPQQEMFPLFQIPPRSNHRPRMRRVLMPHYDISECFEALYQNMIVLDNLKECKTEFDYSKKKIDAFDMKKIKYEVGQWVDVKDTINKWLEAQVIKVNGNHAFVHYNGWGIRWDEWINFESPRMAHFKFMTLQSANVHYMSPYPDIPCDSNIEPQSRSIDSFFYLEKTKEYLKDLLIGMEKLCELRKKDKKMFNDDFLNQDNAELLFLSTQIIPFMDRVGRMLSDISLQLSHLVVNPNHYPQMLMGYRRNQMFDHTKIIEDIKKRNNTIFDSTMFTNSSIEVPKESKVNLKPKPSTTESPSIIQTIATLSNHLIPSQTQIPITIPKQISMTTNTNLIPPSIINTQETLPETNEEPQRQNQSTSTASLREQSPNLFDRRNASLLDNPINIQPTNQRPIQTILGYDLDNCSNDLPFIQRIYSSYTPTDRIVPNSSHIYNLNKNKDLFPLINLQLPAILTPGESIMMNGDHLSSIHEPNYDIIIQTFISQPDNNNRNGYNHISGGTQTQSLRQNIIPQTNNPLIDNNHRESTLQQYEQSSQLNEMDHTLNELLGFTEMELSDQSQFQNYSNTQNIINDNADEINPLQSIQQFYKDEFTQTMPEDFNKK